tara:strand:+ start:500 stop:778 length:279 start_codon:yes stop_codon:yes gene_type:complete
MFILTVAGKEHEGAYSVTDDHGDKILYIFQEEDDAIRFAMMLEDQDYPDMHVLQVEDRVVIATCENHGYNYAVITKNDIVVPPPNLKVDDSI